MAGKQEVAQVKIRIDTGQSKTDLKELGRQFDQTMDGMSVGQRKVADAQRKFQEAFRDTGAMSERTKRAAYALKRAEDDLARSLNTTASAARRQDRALEGSQRSLARMTRGAVAGSGVFQALGRSMAFASAGFIGATGFVYGVRAAIDAGSQLEEQLNQNKEVFQSLSTEVEKFATESLALTKTEALRASSSFGSLLQNMGLTNREAATQSKNLTQLAVDLASFKDTSVEDALAAITSGLVGQVRPLRRYAIEVSAAEEKLVALQMTGKATAAELTREERVVARLAIIYRDSAAAQGDFERTADSLSNQQRILRRNLTNTAAALGTALIPAVKDVVSELNDWLGKEENQKRLQRDLNVILKQGGEIVRGFGTALRFANKMLGPLVNAMGGLEKVVVAAVGFGMILKVKAFATSLGWIAKSATATTAVVVSEAAVMGRALDVATRPRNVVVTMTPVGGKGWKGLLTGGGGKGGMAGFGLGIGAMIAGEQIGGRTGSDVSAAGQGAMLGSIFGPWGAAIGAVGAVAANELAGDPKAKDPGEFKGSKAQAQKLWNAMPASRQQTIIDNMSPSAAQAMIRKWGLKLKSGVKISVTTKKDFMGTNPAGSFRLPGGQTLDSFISSTNADGTGKTGPSAPGASKAQEAAKKRQAMINKLQGKIADLEVDMYAAMRDESLANDLKVRRAMAQAYGAIAALSKGNRQAQKDYQMALNEVYNLEQQQKEDNERQAKERAVEAKRKADAAKAREKERGRQYRAMLAARETRLETAVEGATTLQGLRKKRAALIAFYRARINDKKLTDKEQASYEAELQKTVKGGINDELKLREGTLKRRRENAKQTDTTSDDVIAQKNLIAFYEAAAKRAGQTVKQVRAWMALKEKAQTALTGLMKKDKQKDFTSSMLAMQFLETRADFFSSFGGNAFTGPAGARTTGTGDGNTKTTTVNVNQNFTSSPDDTTRAARYTKFAMDSVMD